MLDMGSLALADVAQVCTRALVSRDEPLGGRGRASSMAGICADRMDRLPGWKTRGLDLRGIIAPRRLR